MADTEMYQHFLKNVLKAGDKIFNFQGELLGEFAAFGQKYLGRLDSPAGDPGLYVNRAEIIFEDARQAKTEDCFLKESTLQNRLSTLPKGWQYISYQDDYLESLPETPFIEGDVVRLVDSENPNFSEDPAKNQFTVNRIAYSKDSEHIYKLKAGNLVFEAEESQLKMAAHGLSPIRIMQGGQALRFKSLRDEAEFHLLIGAFRRIFNPEAFSYKWTAQKAFQMITLCKAHGVVEFKDYNWLVLFEDDEIGRQVASANEKLSIHI